MYSCSFIFEFGPCSQNLTIRFCRTISPPLRGYKIATKLRVNCTYLMSMIAEIKNRLGQYPDLQYTEESRRISVTPEGGFTVWAADNGGSFTIGFEGWHEEFETKEEALDCFAWGLSADCRLMIVSRGGRPHKWTVQRRESGEWFTDSTAGLLFFPYWRKRKVDYKQNAVINS